MMTDSLDCHSQYSLSLTILSTLAYPRRHFRGIEGRNTAAYPLQEITWANNLPRVDSTFRFTIERPEGSTFPSLQLGPSTLALLCSLHSIPLLSIYYIALCPNTHTAKSLRRRQVWKLDIDSSHVPYYPLGAMRLHVHCKFRCRQSTVDVQIDYIR